MFGLHEKPLTYHHLLEDIFVIINIVPEYEILICIAFKSDEPVGMHKLVRAFADRINNVLM